MRRFIIKVDPMVTGTSLFLVVFGILCLSMVYIYPNNDEQLPDCMILEGSLHNWLASLSYLVLAYGGFGLVSGGSIAIALFRMGFVEEGGCLAHVFHGTCGKVIRSILALLVAIYLIHGLKIINTVLHGDVQFEDLTDAKTFCNKNFLVFSVTMACLLSIYLLLFLVLFCYKLVLNAKKKFIQEGKRGKKQSKVRAKIEADLGI